MDTLLIIIIIILVIYLFMNSSKPKKNNITTEKFIPNKNIPIDMNDKSESEDTDVEDTNVEDTNVEDTEVEDTEVEDTEVEDMEAQDMEAQDMEAQDMEAQDMEAQDMEAQDMEAQDTEVEKVAVNVTDKKNKDVIGYNFSNTDNYEMVSNDNIKIKKNKNKTRYNSVIQNQNAVYQNNINTSNMEWSTDLYDISQLAEYKKPNNAININEKNNNAININEKNNNTININKKNNNTININKKNKMSYNSKDYLPKEINDEWFNTDFLQAENKINDNKLINTDKYITGIDTTGQSLKNPTYDIRGTIPNPKISVSPWNNSTYEPDTNLKSLC